jgi:hypothetical protein
MKTNKGFGVLGVVLLLAGILAVGGGAYFAGIKSKTVPSNYNPYVNTDTTVNIKPAVIPPLNTQPILTALPTTCIEKAEGMPVITSISKNAGSVGDRVEIKGCNFSGFEADKNVWIQNSNNEAGIMYGEKESTDRSIIFILKSPLCQTDNSYRGDECQKALNLVPGVYKIFTNPWGKKSNEVVFTINSLNDNIYADKDFVLNGNKCYDRAKYFVIFRENKEEAGGDILVKYKANKDQKIACKYSVTQNDYELSSHDASSSSIPQYVSGVIGDFLVVDEGTGTQRSLLLYNLVKKTKVLNDEYRGDITFNKSNYTLKYNHKINKSPNGENCSTYYMSKTILDLNSLTFKNVGESWCAYVE